MEIRVAVNDKRASVTGSPVIVCNNSGYTVKFAFDAEWDGLPTKTARFVFVQNGDIKFFDAVFTGDTVDVPKLSDTTELRVGAFAGELRTTTPARIPCERSIRCGTGAPADPTPSQYDQIMELLSQGLAKNVAEAVVAYFNENPTPAVLYTEQTLTNAQKAQARANIGATGGSIDVTAEVGQTIIVKEVDANGKPTAWESADYQPRTHWSETVEILPETTVEFVYGEGISPLPVFVALKPNTAYTIKYNGVEYANCVGTEIEGFLCFGNLSVRDESFPATNHPFVLINVMNDLDGNGTVEIATLVERLDGSLTATLSISEEKAHKIPVKYLPDAELVEILPETTAEIPSDFSDIMAVIPVDCALKAGKSYTIIYNGVEYPNCTGVVIVDEILVFGNLCVIDTSIPSTYQPFTMVHTKEDLDADGNSGYVVGILPLDGSTTVTLSILEEKAHTPYYVYDIPFESFEKSSLSNREYYTATIDVVPVELIEAMHLRKPIYLRVIEAVGNTGVAKEYMACATWNCGAIDELWLSADKTLEFVPANETFLVCDMRLSAFISYSINGLAEFYVRFAS